MHTIVNGRKTLDIEERFRKELEPKLTRMREITNEMHSLDPNHPDTLDKIKVLKAEYDNIDLEANNLRFRYREEFDKLII